MEALSMQKAPSETVVKASQLIHVNGENLPRNEIRDCIEDCTNSQTRIVRLATTRWATVIRTHGHSSANGPQTS